MFYDGIMGTRFVPMTEHRMTSNFLRPISSFGI